VVNDLYPRLVPAGSPLVSIRWNTEKLGDSMGVLLAVDRAQSVKQMGEVIAELPATYNTWTVADTQGHIGVFVSGSVPVHEQSLGTFPVPGWVKKYEWARWAKGEELPWAIDPESGILAHANNLMVEPGAKDFVTLNVDAAPGYRHDRIVELLAATPKHDEATFRRVQADLFSPRAKLLLPRLLEDLGDDAELTPKARLAVELLKTWKGEASADDPAPTIFFATWRAAIRHALRDELTEDAIRFFLAQRYSTSTSDHWFELPTHPVWDDTATPQIESRGQVVRSALEAAVLGLWTELGEDVASWTWGRVHWHQPTHAFGNNALLDGTVNLQRHPVGGELDSVWKSHFDVSNERAPFKVVAGPVFRMVADLADLKNESYWIVDTGSSGWPTATHYGDQFERWRRGEMIPMWMDSKRLKGALHGNLTLMPKSLP
jgi:penicillin amidase